jgi:hypothetical protein
MSGVFTQVVAYDESLPEHPVVKTDPDGVYIYGIVPFERTRPVPGAEAWAQAVVDDRSNDAVGRLRIGTLRPRTEAEVLAITETLQHMATVVHVFVDSVSPPVAIDAVIVGGAIEVNTRSGWSARLVAYVPDWG